MSRGLSKHQAKSVKKSLAKMEQMREQRAMRTAGVQPPPKAKKRPLKVEGGVWEYEDLD